MHERSQCWRWNDARVPVSIGTVVIKEEGFDLGMRFFDQMHVFECNGYAFAVSGSQGAVPCNQSLSLRIWPDGTEVATMFFDDDTRQCTSEAVLASAAVLVLQRLPTKYSFYFDKTFCMSDGTKRFGVLALRV